MNIHNVIMSNKYVAPEDGSHVCLAILKMMHKAKDRFRTQAASFQGLTIHMLTSNG